MIRQLKKTLKKVGFSAVLVPFLSGISVADVSPQMPRATHPGRTEGIAFGFGAGVKLLNLKNVTTKNSNGALQRSGDGFANSSSPVISLYARKYMPDLLCLPTFWGLEFNYLTDMRKTSIYASLNPTNALDSGYRYQERWDARAMLGAQLWSGSQLDLWAQAGLQVTYFNYEGRTVETVNGSTQVFRMGTNYALSPTGGLELRFSQPNLLSCGVVTDFILGWTAGYRNAFTVSRAAASGNTFNFAMNSNWSHTFGLKVLFRY